MTKSIRERFPNVHPIYATVLFVAASIAARLKSMPIKRSLVFWVVRGASRRTICQTRIVNASDYEDEIVYSAFSFFFESLPPECYQAVRSLIAETDTMIFSEYPYSYAPGGSGMLFLSVPGEDYSVSELRYYVALAIYHCAVRQSPGCDRQTLLRELLHFSDHLVERGQIDYFNWYAENFLRSPPS